MCIGCVSEKSSRDRVGYFKILVFPFHDVGSLAICTNAIELCLILKQRDNFGLQKLSITATAQIR